MAMPQEPISARTETSCRTVGLRSAFRFLNVIDDYSRDCLVFIVDASLSGRRVVRELSVMLSIADCIHGE